VLIDAQNFEKDAAVNATAAHVPTLLLCSARQSSPRQPGQGLYWLSLWVRCEQRQLGLAALQTGLDTGAGIEVVAEGVADEVEGEHSQGDGSGGEEHYVRGVEQVRATVV
jgi:hypothetical protein